MEGIRQTIQRCLAEDPNDRFQDVKDFLTALERLDDLDRSNFFLRDADINIPTLRVAFSMARIGQEDAEKRLLEWVTNPPDRETHRQASLALAGLPGGVDKIIDRLNSKTAKSGTVEQADSLQMALLHILAFREAIAPSLTGEPWLKRLRSPVRRRLFFNSIRIAFREQRKKVWEALLYYGGSAGIFASIAGLVCSFLGASMFFRFSIIGLLQEEHKVLIGVGPSLVAGGLWGALGAVNGQIGSKLPRPLRFFILLAGGLLVSLFLALSLFVLAGGMYYQGTGGPGMLDAGAVVADFKAFFGMLGLLAGLGMTLALVIKELPITQKRRPSIVISLSLFMGLTGLFVLPIAFIFIDTFLPKETFSIVIIASACGMGAGISDWLLDKRYPPSRSFTAEIFNLK